MAKTIAIPQENITKEQEITIINNFIKALPADSYLAKILEGFDAYCESEIENDWGINPLETINARNENIGTLQQENAKLNREIEAKTENIKNLEERITTLTQDYKDEHKNHLKECGDLRTLVEQANEKFDKMDTKAWDLEMKLQELKAYAWDQYKTIEKLENKIAKMKGEARA